MLAEVEEQLVGHCSRQPLYIVNLFTGHVLTSCTKLTVLG